jgi:hypothetical protein
MTDKPNAYEVMKHLLTRPNSVFPTNSLDVALALIHGFALAQFPPHGSGFLPGFAQFVGRRFHAPLRNHYVILIEQFGHMPLREACDAVLLLLEEWKALEGDQPSDGSTQSSLC